MKKPFVHIVIPLILGIVFCYNINVNTTYLFIAIMFSFFGLALTIIKEKGYSIALIITLFILGGLLTNLKLNESKLMEFVDKEVEITGIVKKVVSQKDNYSRYVVEAKTQTFNQKSYDIKEKMIVKVKGDKYLNIGDEAVFEGTLRQPNENTNSGLFDYRLYLQTNNIFTSITSIDYKVNVLDNNKLSNMEKLALTFRTKIEKVLDENLTKSHSSLMKSMILGESSYLDDDIENRYRKLGLSHILAVSGLHIGIISVFLIYLLGFIGLNRRSSIFLTVFLIWMYGFCIGFPTSVLRASIMFSFLMLANIIYRRYDPINIIAMCAVILLLYNPLWLFSVGFQFSFTATLSLFIFTCRIKKMFSKNYRNIGKILSPLIAVQIGITPVIIYHFNYFSALSIISNLLVIPILSLALIIAFTIIIFSFFTLNIFSYLISIKIAFLSLLLYIADFLTQTMIHLPFNSFTLPSPSLSNMIIYYIIFLIGFRVLNIDSFSYKIKKIIFIYICVFTFISGILLFEMNQKTTVEFIDVGQGDCSLITSGNKRLLIDGGGTPFSDFDVGESIVLPYLHKKGINTLHGIFISHFHKDHCEGIISLLDKINIKNVFIGYENTENQLYMDIKKACDDNNIPITVLKNGDKIIVNKNVNFEVLSSIDYIKNKNDDNNLTMVMMANIYDKKILFTGDIEKKAETIIINNNEKVDIDLLKVAHHGSNTSSNKDFIDFFEPEYAVIQVGYNFFGHPSSETLKRFSDRGIQVYRNDTQGLIRVVIDNKNIVIEPFLPVRESITEFLLQNGLHMITFLLFLWVGIELLHRVELNISKMKGRLHEL